MVSSQPGTEVTQTVFPDDTRQHTAVSASTLGQAGSGLLTPGDLSHTFFTDLMSLVTALSYLTDLQTPHKALHRVRVDIFCHRHAGCHAISHHFYK